MAKASTWMPLYIGDYLADTMHLEAREHGAYLLLLMHYWRTGPLPNDPRGLAVIARVDRRVWASDTGPIVLRFFEERDGFLYQKRMDAELAGAKEISDIKRSAARKRWETPDRKANGPGPAGNASADAYASPHADEVDVQTACPYAGASPSQSQEQKEEPPGPPRGGRRRRRNSVLAMTEAENDAWAEQVLAKVAADRQREREAQEASREAATH